MDAEDDEEDETLANMPRLSVKVQHDVEENFPGEELQDEEHEGEEQDQPMEGVSSQKGEETQEPGYSEQTERPELPEAHSAQDRYGNYIMSQFSRKDFIKLRQWAFNLNFAIPFGERADHPTLPQTVEDVNTFAIALFSEVIAQEPHSSFMMTYPAMTQTNITHDEFHEMKLICKRVMDENENIKTSTFEAEDNPKGLGTIQDKKETEHMTPENKHLILEIDNSQLIDCTVQWLNMLNKVLQKRIVERVSYSVKEEQEETKGEQFKEEEITKEPVIKPTMVSIETQTDQPEESEQPGSSQKGEEPEEKKIDVNADDTAPERNL